MIQTVIPAYRPPINSQPLSSASIASREANSTVVEPVVAKSSFEQTGSTQARAPQPDSPIYEDPRKQGVTPEKNANAADEKNRELAEQLDVQQLSARDREVRAHERAHAAVGGQYASAPTYQYERGPDGVNYAIAGEVSISTSAVAGDPQATMEKAQTIRRAALAPAEPSPQDRQVAAEATKMEVDARAQLSLLQQQTRLEQTQPEGESAAATLNTPINNAEATASINAINNGAVQSDNGDNDKPIQNLNQLSSTIDRLSESLGQKIMYNNTLQDPPAGRLINEIA